MAYVVNASISDTLILRDNTNTAITGKVSADFSTVEAYQVSAAGTTAAVTLTEIGAGEYRISFTPTTPTSGSDLQWTAHVVYNSGGVFREFSETYDVTAAASTVTVVSTATSGALTQTFAQLRQRVADKFEDLVQLVSTANGNVGKTTLIDTYHINPGTEHFNGRDVLCTSGTNAGLKRRVTGTADTTGTLTLNAALTAATATNDTFDVFNRRGRGFAIDQYNRAINNAINDAYPSSVIAVVASITGAFDADTPEITIPAAVTEVTSLEAQDSRGDWHIIPKARSRGGEGWYADADAGQLRLHGRNAWNVDTLSLRVHGFGRQGTLSSESDTCVIRPEFIVAHAAYHLALGAVGNEDMAVRVNSLKRELDEQRVAIRRLREPSTAKIRAA